MADVLDSDHLLPLCGRLYVWYLVVEAFVAENSHFTRFQNASDTSEDLPKRNLLELTAFAQIRMPSLCHCSRQPPSSARREASEDFDKLVDASERNHPKEAKTYDEFWTNLDA